jgi:hypothetical protein
MTEFVQETRKRCRNPKCRMKLTTPVVNEREAFCSRGCHSAFYRKRCLVCGEPMEHKTERQLICGKRKCKNALAAHFDGGRYHTPSAPIHPLKKSIKSGIKSGHVGDRPWRVVAGGLTAAQYHCATVSDAPNGGLPDTRYAAVWCGGDWERIEARNRAKPRASVPDIVSGAEQAIAA